MRRGRCWLPDEALHEAAGTRSDKKKEDAVAVRQASSSVMVL